MARLPVVGGDLDQWGTVLNDYLLVAHNPDGTQIGGSQPGIIIGETANWQRWTSANFPSVLIASGATEPLDWGAAPGVAIGDQTPLIDVANPFLPTFISGGIYVVQAWVLATDDAPASFAYMELLIAGGGDSGLTFPLKKIGGLYGSGTLTTQPMYIEAGASLEVDVANGHSDPLGFYLQFGWIAKLSESA